MDRPGFNNLLNDINSIDQINVEELEALKKQYPYFQNLHFLIAKAYQKTGSEKLKPALNKAAIYSVDRAYLKKILEGDYEFIQIIKSKPDATPKPTTPSKPIPKQEAVVISSMVTPKESVKKASPEPPEPKVQQKKPEPRPTGKKLEKPQEQEAKVIPEKKPVVAKVKPVVEKPQSQPTTAPTPKAVEQSKAQQKTPEPVLPTAQKKESTIRAELEENLRLLSERKKAFKAFMEGTSSKETKTTSKKPPSRKKENQIQLIEKFIKNEPRLERPGSLSDESNIQEDLANKKLKQSDKFLTETLAKLLIKQKKYNKAIDIYEKLKLKFPKKTAYFASQIEKIKETGNVV